MKICMVCQTFSPQEEGGAEISARMGAIELSRRHDVTVLSLGELKNPMAPLGETRHASGFRVVRIPWSNSYLPGPTHPPVSRPKRILWHLRNAEGAIAVKDVVAFFERERFDIIYAQSFARMQPAIYQAARQLKLPLCVHLRDYALMCPRTSMYRRGGNCRKPCLDCRILTIKAKCGDGEGITAISVSDAVRQTFRRHNVLAKAQWHTLHNTNTSLQHFNRDIVGRTRYVSSEFTLGYLGSLTEEKGIADLIRAFKSISGNGKARLLVAGRGRADYTSFLQDLAKGCAVEFLGYVPSDVIYARADAIVLPSRWHEPQARILVEAAVYGVPVIGTTMGGTPEILSQHRTGWCYDPHGQGNLVRLLRQALAMGPERWWQERDLNFPGIAAFKGTAEASGYYDRLEEILQSAAG